MLKLLKCQTPQSPQGAQLRLRVDIILCFVAFHFKLFFFSFSFVKTITAFGKKIFIVRCCLPQALMKLASSRMKDSKKKKVSFRNVVSSFHV